VGSFVAADPFHLPAGSENGPSSGARWPVVHADPVELEGLYATIMVQDDGPKDWAEGTFDDFNNSACGNAQFFQLEPVQGKITVHDR
jgi:hypothetical protein